MRVFVLAAAVLAAAPLAFAQDDKKVEKLLEEAGKAYLDGKTEDAIKLARDAIRLDPKFALAHGNLGLVLRKMGQLDEAIASLRKAIELNPKDGNSHYNLGNMVFDKQQWDEAITCYQKAIAIHPRNASGKSPNRGEKSESARRASTRGDQGCASLSVPMVRRT